MNSTPEKNKEEGAQEKNMVERDPLYIPYGSIRAIIALITCGTILYQLLVNAKVPLELNVALFIILGYYFGHRTTTESSALKQKTSPLGLPRGSVRGLIFIGFVATTVVLYHDGRLFQEEPLTVMGLAFGLFLGAGFKWIAQRMISLRYEELIAFINHVKAILALIAALGFSLIVIFDKTDYVSQDVKISFISILSFYFGSR